VSISGLTPEQWEHLYYERVNNTKLPSEIMKPQGTDAIWAVALALNNVRELLELEGAGKYRVTQKSSYPYFI
jgi:hypothetical protein